MSRLTTDEILDSFPSMLGSGRETVSARYYGDMPVCILNTEFRFPDDRHLCNLEGVDVFIARQYEPAQVEKYEFCHGDGYKIKDGPVIAGSISIRYGNSWPYELQMFNHHAGLYGFRLSKQDTGKYTYIEYNTRGFCFNPWNAAYRRKIIDLETIEKVFHRVETSDNYGAFVRAVVQTCREIWDDVGKECEYDS